MRDRIRENKRRKMRLPNKVQILSNGKCEIDIDIEDRRELNKIKERRRGAFLDKTKDYIFAGGFEVDVTRANNGHGKVKSITIINCYPALAVFDYRTVCTDNNVIVSIADEKIDLNEIVSLAQMLGAGYDKEYVTEYNNAVAQLILVKLRFKNKDAVKLEINLDYKKRRFNKVMEKDLGV